MKLTQIAAATLAVLSLSLGATPALAGADEDQAQARKDLERARQEVEKARGELQRATRELARSMSKVERDNPRVQYFEYMTDPDRAVLGVLIPDESENPDMRGVRLLAVTPGSGAEKAGLKAGDLVTAINGTTLAGDAKRPPQVRMKDVMRTLKAGDEARIDYERDGKSRSATVVTQAPEPEIAFTPLPMLEEWLQDEDFDKDAMGSVMPWLNFRGPAIRGLELCKLDDDLGSYFKTKDGVLVIKAPKKGALNLKSGDVILKIDGDAVSEPVTVLDKLRSRREVQTVQLDILRQGRKLQLEGKIPVAELAPRKKGRRIEMRPDHAEEEDDGS